MKILATCLMHACMVLNLFIMCFKMLSVKYQRLKSSFTLLLYFQ